jgi:acetyl-CoA C-acetyltransferase
LDAVPGRGASTAGLTVNRLCGSGLQAIISAAQAIMLGDTDAAVAGGAESMSRGQYWLPDMRWGRRMQDAVAVDAMVGAVADPFDHCHMGVTAENVAAEYGISRADQDSFAAESHRRAAFATEAGYFAEQMTPINVESRKSTTVFAADEHIRPGLSAGDLAKLRPAFDKSGSVTAGNASGVNDAAAAVVLASAPYAAEHKLRPIGRLVAYGQPPPQGARRRARRLHPRLRHALAGSPPPRPVLDKSTKVRSITSKRPTRGEEND